MQYISDSSVYAERRAFRIPDDYDPKKAMDDLVQDAFTRSGFMAETARMNRVLTAMLRTSTAPPLEPTAAGGLATVAGTVRPIRR